MSLKFKIAKNTKDLEKIVNYDVEAFSDTAGVEWSMEGLKKEMKEGWEVYSVWAEEGLVDEKASKEIMAVLFVKVEDKVLHTKNTPIKMSYQGQGFSHLIKEFFEDMAKKGKFKEIVSYCLLDNFRAISLNETHGYTRKKEFQSEDGKTYLEWSKKLK